MPKDKITERQKEALKIIYKHIENFGYPPTMEEMRQALNVSSNQSVIDLLNHLERKNYIRKQGGVARSIVILPTGHELLGKPPLAPFLGITHAGAPINTIELDGEWHQLSGEVAKLNSEVFFVKVNGDSMINAGIEDGDKVLVQVKKEFSSGDIVLADVDGESTIKRFISEDKAPYLYLKPENPEYDIICFTEKVRLKGKIISVIKDSRLQNID